MISWRYTENCMTIDERLEKLVDRHEALTLTVELLAHRVEDLATASQRDGENIRALARIAEIHGDQAR
jgi:hypothetical protein